MRTVYRVANNSERLLAVVTLACNIEPRDRLERVEVRRAIEDVVLATVGAQRHEILVARAPVFGNPNAAHESWEIQRFDAMRRYGCAKSLPFSRLCFALLFSQ